MKVLIVGGGIAGLTLAAFLKDTEVSCTIIEKAPDWSHAGFLVSLWDSARDILKKIGLSDQFDAAGSPAHMYSVRTGSGDTIRTIDLSQFCSEYGSAITVVPRAELHRWLCEKIGVDTIRMGLSIEEISQDARGVSVMFTNGERAVYDAVVGADGVHSQVRRCVFRDYVESYENWRV